MIFDGSTLWIQTPSPSARVWIEQQLAEDFHDALVQCDQPNLRLVFAAVERERDIAERLKALGLRAKIQEGLAC